jgi:hypothetical protein
MSASVMVPVVTGILFRIAQSRTCSKRLRYGSRVRKATGPMPQMIKVLFHIPRRIHTAILPKPMAKRIGAF